MTQTCRVCNQSLPLTSFDDDKRSSVGKKVGRCRQCVKSGGQTPATRKVHYDQEYARNAERYRQRARDRYAELRDLIHAARAHPCVDCGVTLPPGCMDLDHVRDTKLFNLGQFHKARLIPGLTREAMIHEEIAKCDVRCPNCHRLRHYYANAAITASDRGPLNPLAAAR